MRASGWRHRGSLASSWVLSPRRDSPALLLPLHSPRLARCAGVTRVPYGHVPSSPRAPEPQSGDRTGASSSPASDAHVRPPTGGPARASFLPDLRPEEKLGRPRLEHCPWKESRAPPRVPLRRFGPRNCRGPGATGGATQPNPPFTALPALRYPRPPATLP